MSWYGYPRYVPVAERRAQAKKKMEKLRKKGLDIMPVVIEGRKIAKTFWGQAWCDHLESFSDYANRLPRGRTYVRNGSVCHLNIAPGEISAFVSGSSLYTVTVEIKPLAKKKWESLKTGCAGKIGSLLELLQGRLSENVMSVVTDRKKGLFPLPGEINLHCSCPDWADMCKHVAATLYAVGARLDERPELLFLLRGTDHEELISIEVDTAATATTSRRRMIADEALSDVFGVEITESVTPGTAEIVPPMKKPSRTSSGRTRVTGKTVANLRTRLGMSRKDFGILLGVSLSSLANWEKTPGRLRLQPRTLEAINSAGKLTKKAARRKVDGR
jgi:uncharacterized Zn finger protein